MKAHSSLERRVIDLEKRFNDIRKVKDYKMDKAKLVLTLILILEKLWNLIKYFFSQ